MQNEDVINELEKKLANMNIEQVAEDKSKTQADLDKGVTKVGSEERRVAKGNRKTQEGKQKQAETEEQRKKNEAIVKATLKQKGEKGTEEDDEGWDSVEEDFPHIKLDDLKDLASQLEGMNIEGGDDDEDEDFEDEDEEESKSNAKGEQKKAKK